MIWVGPAVVVPPPVPPVAEEVVVFPLGLPELHAAAARRERERAVKRRGRRSMAALVAPLLAR
jgi:hypothetical protein